MNTLQLSIGARTVWGEARNQGPEGMSAVAHVLMNRVKDGRWGPTLFHVCLAPYQFSSWNVGDPNRNQMLDVDDSDAALRLCTVAMDDAMSGDSADPTGGATFYKVVGTPAMWAVGKTPCATIGAHEFYRDIA